MTAFETRAGGRGCRRWNHGLAALALACGAGAWAQVVSVPTAHLHHTEGSVAYAPQGDREWHDVQPRRLLKRGDRLWTDRGSRAEVQASGHALRLDGETQLVLENVSETAAQLSLTQGSVVATVTHMNPGDSFEVGTPNLAFRARQPGDYRIDVDVKQGLTRLVVLSGAGVVYGEKGEALEVRNGQRLTFRERSLTRVQQPAFAATDDFDRWAGARRRGEPTVTMPTVAATPPAAPAPTYSGRTIIISGSAASLKNAPATPAAKPLAAAPAAAAQVQAARPAVAQPAAGPMRVNIPSTPAAALVAPATVPAPAAAPQPQDNQRLAQQRAHEERQAAARAERERRAAASAAAEAKKAEERRRAVAARRADDERRQAQARRAEDERRQAQARSESDQKRLAARRAEDERRQAQARRDAAEKRLAAAREAEAQKVAEQARRRQLARLQEQAQREEQAVQSRREQARRAEEERREAAYREEQVRREAEARREEQARREEEFRRQRTLADQWRRDHERREQEVWLRQQQYQQPVRPAPMGVPARRIS